MREFSQKQKAYLEKLAELQARHPEEAVKTTNGVNLYPVLQEGEERVYTELDTLWWQMSQGEQDQLDDEVFNVPTPEE